jgi:succinate dehydrogenase / fumarate reductase cytochrome b subunit
METTLYNILSMLRYRGREGQWSWLLHRASGLGVMLFLLLHVTDIFLVSLGAETFNSVLFIYRAAPFRVLEVFLIFGLLFHAANGIRITVLDFWPRAWRHQRILVWAQAIIVAAAFIPAAVVTLSPIFSGA